MNTIKKICIGIFLGGIASVGVFLYISPKLELAFDTQKTEWRRQQDITHRLIATTEIEMDIINQINLIAVLSQEEKVHFFYRAYLVRSLPKEINKLKEINAELQNALDMNMYRWLLCREYLLPGKTIWWDNNFTELILLSKNTIINGDFLLIGIAIAADKKAILAKMISLSKKEAERDLFTRYAPALQTLERAWKALEAAEFDLKNITRILHPLKTPV